MVSQVLKNAKFTPKNTIFAPDPKKIVFVLVIVFVFVFVFVMIGNVRAMVMAVEQRFLLTVGQEGVKCWVTTMPHQDERAACPCCG